MLVAMVLASAVGLLAWGPIPDGARWHRLTDTAVLAGLVNGWSVWLQGPLLVAALSGASRSQGVWRLFFAAVALAVVAGIADHLAPSTPCFVLDKLATGSACVLLAMLFLAERLGPRWTSAPALAVALAAGPLGAALALLAVALTGQPDLRLLLWLEHLPLLLAPVSIWSLPSRGVSDREWFVALLALLAAKALDFGHLGIWLATGAAISGHALHHLPLAVAVGWLAWRVALQAPGDDASRASTSVITAG